MYVLLYLNESNNIAYVQANNTQLLNQQIRTLWEDGCVDRDAWDDTHRLLCIENDELTPVNRWDCEMVPQFTVY